MTNLLDGICPRQWLFLLGNLKFPGLPDWWRRGRSLVGVSSPGFFILKKGRQAMKGARHLSREEIQNLAAQKYSTDEWNLKL